MPNSKELSSEATVIHRLVESPMAQSLIDWRLSKNVNGTVSLPDTEDFWKELVLALASSVQPSTEGSPLDRFGQISPFPLRLSLYKTLTDDKVSGILKQFGFRFHGNIAGYLRSNFSWLFGNGNGWGTLLAWFKQLAEQRNTPPAQSQKVLERKAARVLADNLRGIGPKQSRNVIQELGLSRYEIPLDSRVTGWLEENFRWGISNYDLSTHKGYEKLLDRVQVVCAEADVLPTIFDAAAYTIGILGGKALVGQTVHYKWQDGSEHLGIVKDYRRKWAEIINSVSKHVDWVLAEDVGAPVETTTAPAAVATTKTTTTARGFVNRNEQVVIRNTGLPGTDHQQIVYQLGCSICGHVYGANGSDIHLRLCPKCQGGAAGLSL